MLIFGDCCFVYRIQRASRAFRFCIARESRGEIVGETCDVCDASDWRTAHPPSHLTDLSTARNQSCWISAPTLDHPHNVSLTLSLGKKFELTYVSLQFCGRVADSLAIYKSTNFGRTWTPLQFFSSECEKIYGRAPNVAIGRHNEQASFSPARPRARSLARVRILVAAVHAEARNFDFLFIGKNMRAAFFIARAHKKRNSSDERVTRAKTARSRLAELAAPARRCQENAATHLSASASSRRMQSESQKFDGDDDDERQPRIVVHSLARALAARRSNAIFEWTRSRLQFRPTRHLQEARCIGSHIAASPTKSNNQVAFATLENRPSAYEFERSFVLQDFVTATDIKITFNRLSREQVSSRAAIEQQSSNRRAADGRRARENLRAEKTR